MSISPLLLSLPKLQQINTQNTCNGKVLDVLLTNLSKYYNVPTVVPPVTADDPNHGSPSDHSPVIAVPLANGTENKTKDYMTRTFRPLPDSGIEHFGEWLDTEDWITVQKIHISPSEQVNIMQDLMNEKLDKYLPKKSARFTTQDQPYITCQLKKLDRRVKKEYSKKGSSLKYETLKAEYDEKRKKAAKSHIEKNVHMLMESEPGKAYATLKRMGAQPGDNLDDGSYNLIEHLEANLTNSESVERIASYFARVSQEYPPLNISTLPASVKSKLDDPDKLDQAPVLSESEIMEKIMKSKKPKSGIPGDLPRRIV